MKFSVINNKYFILAMIHYLPYDFSLSPHIKSMVGSHMQFIPTEIIVAYVCSVSSSSSIRLFRCCMSSTLSSLFIRSVSRFVYNSLSLP